MKRLNIFLLSMAIAICTNAQFKGSVSVAPNEPEKTYQIAFNFISVCKSMGVDYEEFAPILNQWLYDNRDRNTVYENMSLVYMTSDANHPKAGGDTHGHFIMPADGSYKDWTLGWSRAWGCDVTLNLKMNTLSFNVYLASGALERREGKNPLVKVGDCLKASFAVAYKEKVATFDVAINIVEGSSGVEIPITSFDKVGEKTVSVKYIEGKAKNYYLNLDSIAACFGEGVRGGNLQMYVYANHDKKMLTDRYAYDISPYVVLEDNCVARQPSENNRCFALFYCPLSQCFDINPALDAFEEGEHAIGSLFLVSEGKYFELKMDIQFGNAHQEELNLATVAAAEQCGKFTQTITVQPDLAGPARQLFASFSLPAIAKALGTDCDELLRALKSWKEGNEMPDGSEMIYNLSDHASTKYIKYDIGGYNLDKDGKAYRFGGDWGYYLDVNSAMRELKLSLFCQYQMLKDGDVCHVRLGFYYKGRMAELEVTLNVKENQLGELIALNSLKKVGEQVVSGIYTPTGRMEIKLDLNSIASHFDGEIAGKALKLYVMSDAKNQLLTDRYSYEIAPVVILDIESTEHKDYNFYAYYSVMYFPYEELLSIGANLDALKGGQKSSGSLFLVDDGQYYELVMDIQFGTEQDKKDYLDVIATEQMDVKLMLTNDYYSYYNQQTGKYALIQSSIDWKKITELLETENPMLYAEEMTNEQVTYTCHYNAAPGQGFWFAPCGQQAYRASISRPKIKFGMYYSDGSFKWYSVPYEYAEVGEAYTINLYFVNQGKGKAVKYAINVEFVDEIDDTEYCYVRRLPEGLGVSTGIDQLTTVPSKGEGTIYNLSGQRIKSIQKGLNIIDGRKVWVK